MNAIFQRVSIRKYTDQAIEPEKIEKLLRAAMAAPSAVNQQPWEFYVVTDQGKIRALSEATPYAKPAKGAPVVFVPCCRKECVAPEYALLDISAAVENLLLEAQELGLGAVWMAIAPQRERMEAVREILSVPDHLEPFALISCGYPAESREQKDRYDEARVHYVR